MLRWTAAGPLVGDDATGLDQFATPHTPRLGALHRAGQALDPYRAIDAERLGEFELSRCVGEPQVGVEGAAGEVGLDCACRSTRTNANTTLFLAASATRRWLCC